MNSCRYHNRPVPMVSGLSMAAHAYTVSGPAEREKAMRLLGERYPEYTKFLMPKPEEIRIFRVKPKVISLIDYSKVLSHIEYVTV